MDNSPILSICIPTYNRSQQLKQCLDSIVSQKEFLKGEVEIVISDNCSTDDTEEIAISYCEKYKCCHYYRNNENVRDKNFPLAIDRGTGVYRKLSNDTMVWDDKSLAFMLNIIKENIAEKPVLTFLPEINGAEFIRASSIDETLLITSHICTAISCFGVWADDFFYTEDGCEKFLWQTVFFLKNIVLKGDVVVVRKNFYNIVAVKKKDLSYGFFNVFHNNLLEIIKYWIDENKASKKTYDKIKKDILIDVFSIFLAEYKVENKDKFVFSKTEDFEKCIEKTYKNEDYYKEFLRKTRKIEFSLRYPKIAKFARKILRIIRGQKG